MLAAVADPLALVGLGLPDLTDTCCRLAHLLLVRAPHVQDGRRLNDKLDPLGCREGNRVAVSDVQLYIAALLQHMKVLNRDAHAVSYRVSFTSLIAKDKGKDAREWVRFSPRRIHLGPGEHQTIRVVVRKPADLAPGEYTARLLIQAIPPVRKPTEEATENIQVNLDIVYGVSIPIHIKHNP